MFDETQKKIIDATMNLIMEKGYSATTTKDIAYRAGINECTIFRKFKGKKEIVLKAMTLSKWNPQLKVSDFAITYNLKKDLLSFSYTYLSKVTPHMVKVSIGLRSPDLYESTEKGIMEIPYVFKNVLKDYFQEMYKRNKIKKNDFEVMAVQFLSMNFGFVFFKASFDNELTEISNEMYITNSVDIFIQGII
ncbi:MAG: helix-turn-helix domain-containing protein [Faecalibacillus sp.]